MLGASIENDRLVAIGLWVLAAVGVVVRLRQLIYGRSFWLDETFVANDLADQSFVSSLIDGSPRNQMAPAGFWTFGHAAEAISSRSLCCDLDRFSPV